MKVLVYYMFIASGNAKVIKDKLEEKRQELLGLLGSGTKILMVRKTAGDDSVETLELDSIAPPLTGTYPWPVQPYFTPTVGMGPMTTTTGVTCGNGGTGYAGGGTANCGNVIDAAGKFTGC